MTRKSALFALAVVVLMGSMAVAALADDQGVNMPGPAESSVSDQPEQGVEQPDAGEIREPMETGAVPDRSESSSDLHSNAIGDEPTVESGGVTFRPDIDLGP
ncbi:hypothetical protein [Candidatus Deferrimicrobium sp.]|uniref:hypothetical protein n=1 Tax=Candidatus Deferrimicrobium sp. TaxID=3060586 RepID=UPI00271BCA80|nr:hypothetical protein [Candidatus Deferrimicrobium sp.]MDO8739382.1 hypothetical protein [Candidatus Deferrimicrobium sp.]